MADASNESRIGRVPWEPSAQVSTAWDLGFGDTTVIWFYQQTGYEVRVIDYYEMSGQGLDHYAKILREKPYTYKDHAWPHDGGNGDVSTGKTRVQVFSELGFSARVLNRDSNVADGINAVRLMLPKCYFDAAKCAQGIEALRQYRCEYDPSARIFKNKPLHNWASNGADAFRTLARALPDIADNVKARRDRYRPYRDGAGSTWMSNY
jgi:phage terminase large subunit